MPRRVFAVFVTFALILGACSLGPQPRPAALPTDAIPPIAAEPATPIIVEQPTAAPSPTALPVPAASAEPVVDLASGQAKLWDIAVDDTDVYWTTCGTDPQTQDGGVWKAAKAGGAPVALASGQACPTDIALDGASVYWLAGSFEAGYAIRRLPKAGGDAESLAAGGDIRSLAVDDSGVYWSDCQAATDACVVMRLQAGGAPVPLAGVTAGLAYPDALALDATDVYWVNGSTTIMHIAKDALDGTPQVLVSSQFYPQGLAADDDYVYWFGLSYVMQVAKADGARIVLAHDQTAADLAVDETHVYWANYDGNVLRAPKGGGPLDLIAADAQGGKNLAIDPERVYWSNFDLGTLTAAVKSAAGPAPALPETGPVALATAQESLTGLVADVSGLYWSFCGTEAANYQDGGLQWLAAGGASPATLASAEPCPLAVAADASNVFWFTGRLYDDRPGDIVRVGNTGGERSVLRAGQVNVGGFVLDGDRLLWSTCGGGTENLGNPAILAVSVAGGEPAVLASDCGLLAADETYIYWTNAAGTYRLAKAGGEPESIGPGGSDLLVDETNVYVTTLEGGSESTFGSCADERSSLISLPKGGAGPVVLATLEGGSLGLAGNATELFWATDCSQGIVAVPKTGGEPAGLAAVAGRIEALASDGAAIFWINSEYGTVNKLTR